MKATKRVNHLSLNKWNSSIYEDYEINTISFNENIDVTKLVSSYIDAQIAEYEHIFEYAELHNIEDIYNNNIHVALVKSTLLGLFSKGNIQALVLLQGANNSACSIEDLASTCLLRMIELETIGYEICLDGKLNFADDFIRNEIYKSISNELYRHATRHYKRMYIELDNELVRINDIQGLASHISIDNVINNDVVNTFMRSLSDNELTLFMLRLQGLSIAKCSDNMSLSIKQTRTIEKHMRNKWHKINN